MRKLLLAFTILAACISPAFAELVAQKNVAYTIETFIWKNDGTKLTSVAGLDSEYSYRDAGGSWSSFTDCTNEATEDGTTGDLRLVVAQAEMNHEWVRVQIKSSSTGAVLRTITIRTVVGNPSLMYTVANGTQGVAQSGDAYSDTHTNGVVILDNGITANKIAANAIGASQIADNAIDAGAIAAGAITSSEAPNLDTTVSSRMATFTYTAPPTVGEIQAELEENGASLLDTLADRLTATRAGYLDNLTKLDANVSTRSSHSAADVWSNGTRTLTAGTNIGFPTVANIWDADISAYSGTKAGTYLKGIYDKLPAGTIGTGTSTLTAADVWQTDISGYSTAGQAGTYLKGASAPSAATVADAVWDEAIADHLTSGKTGAALNAAGSAGDPWNTPLPGEYTAGTAGYIIGHNIDATITSRMATFTIPTNFNLLSIDTNGRMDLGKWKGTVPSDLSSGKVQSTGGTTVY